MSTGWTVTQRIHIDRLPAATRARLVASLGDGGAGGDGHPLPILAHRLGIVRLAAVTAVAVLAAVAVATSVLDGRGAVGDGPDLGLGATLLTVAVLTAAGAAVGCLVHRVLRIVGSPIWPGIYVLAADVVDARGPVLRVTSVASTRVDAVHQQVSGVYIGTVITFRAPAGGWRFVVRGRRDADSRLSAIRSAVVVFLAALERRDLATLERVDPFFVARLSGEWRSSLAERRRVAVASREVRR